MDTTTVQHVFFDLDSTLIEQESLDELAREVGAFDAVARITEQAMAEGLDFQASLRRRLRVLGNVHLQQINLVLDRIQFRPGAEQWVAQLQEMGFTCHIVTGALSIFAQPLAKRLRIPHLFSQGSSLGANGINLHAPYSSGQAKGDYVAAWKEKTKQVHQSEGFFVGVGDGANDRLFLELCDLAIGVRPKEILLPYLNHQVADFADHDGLRALLDKFKNPR